MMQINKLYSWALFHMRQPTIIFEPEARYIFVTDNRDVGVSVAQRLNIRLGDMAYQCGDTECMAVVCRVQVRIVILSVLKMM